MLVCMFFSSCSECFCVLGEKVWVMKSLFRVRVIGLLLVWLLICRMMFLLCGGGVCRLVMVLLW